MANVKKYASLDLEVWTELKTIQPDDGPDLLNEVREMFLKFAPEHIEKIAAVLAANNPLGLYREAHSFKSSTAHIGALKMTEFCLQLEKLGKSGTIDGAQNLFKELTSEFERVKTELASVVGDA